MSDVVIKKLDNVFVQILADAGIKMGMSEHFARYVKGYMFQPKYKARMWDGKIRLFNYQRGTIYGGLVKDVLEYCKEEGLTVKIEPEVKELFWSGHDTTSYIDKMELSAHGKKIEFRDYQKEAIRTSVEQKRRIIQSPTSSGKSSVIYGISRYLLDEVFEDNERILIIVPTLGLITQMRGDFADYSSLNGWDVDEMVSCSTDKKKIMKRVHVSTWQSCYKNPKEWFDSFRCLIVDEAHGATATSIKSVGEKCNAEFRIGLSGSIDFEDETFELSLRGLFGFRHITTTTRKLMNAGVVAKLHINCIHVKYDSILPVARDYKKEIDWIVARKERNEFIIDLANKVEGNVLILFSLVEKHGKVLLDIAKLKAKDDGKEVFFVYGGTDADAREKVRQIAETHKGCIILASYQTFSTGVSIRNLHHLMLASPTKSYTRVVQSIGRSLRISDSKTHATLYDFFDEIYGKPKDAKSYNYTYQHFIDRVKIYIKEGFKYSIDELVIGV